MKFGILTRTFRAAVQFAAVKDVRSYLVGVYVTKNCIVATDGNIMGIFEAFGAAGDVIIPLALVQQVLKAAKKAKQVEVEILDGKISLTVNGTTFSGAPVEGKFPDYQLVIPSETSGEMAQFDPALINRAMTGLAAFHEIKPNMLRLEHNGPAPGVVWRTNYIGAVGIIMPMRSNADAAALADRLRWAKENKEI